MIKLGVNIDHVATLRQARRGTEPDIAQAALEAEMGGGDAITVHLREDRRHIQDHDVRKLKQSVKTTLNLEMAVSDEIVRIALEIKPHQACIVPEKRTELTTEGGLDVTGSLKRIKDEVSALAKAGISVSLFIEPDKAQIEAAAQTKAPMIELHTGRYANLPEGKERDTELRRLVEANSYARSLGLTVNAGHGLDYRNINAFKQALPSLYEVNIGYSIVCRSVFTGLRAAVCEMKRLLA